MDIHDDNSPKAGNDLAIAGVVYALIVGVVSLGLHSLGKFTPRMVTDSSSYTEFVFAPLSEALQAQRTLGYPIFLQVVSWFGDPLSWTAVAHWLAHLAACGVFAWGLRAIWRSSVGCVVVASSMLFANLIYRYLDNMTPDVLTASVAIATIGIALRFAQSNSWSSMVAAATGVFVCCQLRPAYLFLVPLLPLLVAGLRWINGQPMVASARKSIGMLTSCVVPTAVFCLVRYGLVGYVGLVSFGGNNMAGVMSAFLDESTVAALPASSQELGAEVLKRRGEYALEHPEFPTGVVTSYSAIENQFDDSTWRICVPAALELHDDDWPEANRSMMMLGFGIVKANPKRFLVWLLKASRRAVQVLVSEFVGNPVYLLLLFALGGTRLWRFARSRTDGDALLDHEVDRVYYQLVWVALLFFVAKTALVILTSPPLGRFMDAAGIFVCTVPAYLLWRDLVAIFCGATPNLDSPQRV